MHTYSFLVHPSLTWCSPQLHHRFLAALLFLILTTPVPNHTTLEYLSCTISWKASVFPRAHTSRRTIWRYLHADFAKDSQMISETNWDALYSEDINLYCISWQQTFLSIMEQCIPKKGYSIYDMKSPMAE